MTDYEFKSEAEAWVMIPLLKNNGTECVLDMRPLVLCKDCKFAFQHWNNLYRCDNYHGTPNGYGEHQGEWFCADGERKDNG